MCRHQPSAVTAPALKTVSNTQTNPAEKLPPRSGRPTRRACRPGRACGKFPGGYATRFLSATTARYSLRRSRFERTARAGLSDLAWRPAHTSTEVTTELLDDLSQVVRVVFNNPARFPRDRELRRLRIFQFFGGWRLHAQRLVPNRKEAIELNQKVNSPCSSQLSVRQEHTAHCQSFRLRNGSRRLLRPRSGPKHGEWGAMFKNAEMPFSQSTANRLIAIACNDNVRNEALVPRLPVAWAIL